MTAAAAMRERPQSTTPDAVLSALDRAALIGGRIERLPMTGYQLGILLIVATAYLFDSMDLGAMTFLLGSIRTEFHLSAAAAGLLSSMSFVGMAVGASLAGILADRFGRLSVFQASMVLWGTGSILCGLAPTAFDLGLARVLLGIGMGMEFPIAQAIASEMLSRHRRGRAIALLDGAWPLGFILSGVVSYLVLRVSSWHAVFLVQGLPAAFLFVVRRGVPESPRWLAARGRMDEAEAVMARIETEVAARHAAPLPVAVPEPVQGGDRRSSFATLWQPPYLRRTIMVWSLWFFALLGFYGLTTWLGALLQQAGFPVMRSVFYTLMISLGGIPGFLFAAWAVEVIGRKASCVVVLLGSAASAFLYGSAASQTGLMCFGLLMQFFLFGMWAVVFAYTPELYPTHARATGCGFASAAGRIGSLIGPYVVGLVLPAAGQSGVFALGAASFVVAALAVVVLGPETSGRSLEELAT